MEQQLSDLLDKISCLRQEVQDYITNTEHYIFYWISENEVIKDFIKQHPDDYEELIEISVESITNASAYVRIQLGKESDDDDDEEEPVVIRRYCHFSTFKEHTHDRWERFNGKIKEARIKEVQKIIDYYKAKLDEYENQLKGLKGENK